MSYYTTRLNLSYINPLSFILIYGDEQEAKMEYLIFECMTLNCYIRMTILKDLFFKVDHHLGILFKSMAFVRSFSFDNSVKESSQESTLAVLSKFLTNLSLLNVLWAASTTTDTVAANLQR